ncbi:MAG: YgjV family protein [Lachnospiraceae bacterium]|nr:YgjV family protein [Lachnospiraceae bacterium]
MEMKGLIIQGIGFLGTILFFLSFQCKSNKKLFRVQFVSYLCYTGHLILLGAVTGGISYVLNTVRSFCLGSKNKHLKGIPACCIICVLQLVALYFTWDGPISILPVAANIASTIGGYTYNARTIRLAGMLINSPLWIVYDILVGSWAGILDEVVSEASMILSIVRFGWKNLDTVEE